MDTTLGRMRHGALGLLLGLGLTVVAAVGQATPVRMAEAPGMAATGAVVPVSGGGIAILTEAAHLEHLLHMDVSRLLALASGVTVGQIAMELVLPGANLGFFAMVGGAMLGNWWYDRRMWPFEGTDDGAGDGPAHGPQRKSLDTVGDPGRKPMS